MKCTKLNRNEKSTENKNPVTLKSVLGLFAVLGLALALCAPYARIPGSGNPAKTPAAIETRADAAVADPTL